MVPKSGRSDFELENHCFFYIRVLNLVVGGSLEIQFLAIFYIKRFLKGNLIDFEIYIFLY